MNSKQLKQKYHDEYKKFFTEHNIVLSMPLLINWAWDIRDFNGVSIKQKIPLRIYGGVKTNNSGEITLNKITKQNIYTNEKEDYIETRDLINYAPYIQDIENYLNKNHQDLIKQLGGIEINIFSEVNRGVGLGYDSILAMLIGALTHRLKKTFTNEEYEKINNLDINTALNNKLYQQIFEEGKNISKIMFGYGLSGDRISSFFSGNYPTVTNAKLLEGKGDSKIFKYRGFRLNELFEELPERPYTPIDFGLIFSGQPTFIEQILGTYENNSGGFSSIKDELQKDIKGKFTYENKKDKPDFFSLLENNNEAYHAYGAIMGTISLKILHFMHKAYKKSYNEGEMRYLFQSLKMINTYQTISRPFSKRYRGFKNKLWDNFDGDASRLTLFPNDTGTVGGCLCFTTPIQVYRNHIKNMITPTKYEGRKLIYSSRDDGIEFNGLIFEQDIDNSIFSEFIEPNNYILKKIDGSNELGDHETLIKKCNEGLLLDTIGNKIYLNGTKLTSKDIPSQTTTIETLGFLIHNIGKEISNKELPNSSYSKNKNEMLGKIVLPLIKLLEEKLKRKLPLICKGSIYDFYIKLDKTEIPIYIIQSI